jgi:hypothetical protein|tara:strand:- start:2009 stop:2227 length:219 start_codon:yes stop_codon:yes gene_type:complete
MVPIDVVAVVLIASAVLLLRELIRKSRFGDDLDEESEYSGSARNPDALLSADDQALEELDRLLDIFGADMDE